MGPGMFDDMWKGFLFLAVLIALSAGVCGFGLARCDSVYRIRIEKAEPAPKTGGEP